MRCCVAFCENTLQNASNDTRVSFYAFPNKPHLHAAWLKALDLQGSLLSDSAVVCSQHFLNEQFYETDDGSKHLREDAVPSAVLVCLICLNRDSDLVSLVKCNLDEAYQILTGHSLLNEAILKQTICTECAQRLINFSQLRHRSLRAHSLMMDLVKQHKSITLQQMKLINQRLNTQKSNTLSSSESNCNLSMHAHVDAQELMELDNSVCDAVDNVAGKNKILSTFPNHAKEMTLQINSETVGDCNDVFVNDLSQDSVFFEVNQTLRMALLESTLNIKECLNNESAMLKHTVGFEEFPNEHTYNKQVEINHMGHTDSGFEEKSSLNELCPPTIKHKATLEELREESPSSCQDAPPSSLPMKHLTHIDTEVDPTSDIVGILDINIHVNTKSYSNHESYDKHTLKNCFVKLYDVLHSPNIILKKQSGSLSRTPIRYVVNESISKSAAGTRSVTTKREKIRRVGTRTELSSTRALNVKDRKKTSQTKVNYTCESCNRQFKYKSIFLIHMRKHTGEKPFSCKLCEYKCTQQDHLVRHLRTHTGEKLYSCKLCEYKCSISSNLVKHVRKHTGDKPYSCKLCEYKFARQDHLVNHLRTHSGEKPYSCKLCEYKGTQHSSLVKHMRTHTGEKPYSCKLCEYKCSISGNLVKHMRKHTGDKPYSCKLCEYKFAQRDHLVNHLRTHTGEKPYSCTVCGYKSSKSDNLVKHMRTHTGEKPYSCKLCEYKFARHDHLVNHMRTHTKLMAHTITE